MSTYDSRMPNRLFLAIFIISIGALSTQCSGWSRNPGPAAKEASAGDVAETVAAPTDTASTGCTVTPAEFAAWFQGGSVSKGGMVKWADSLAPLTHSASSTARTHPWGNKPDSSSAQNNTYIISLNRSIQGMLSAKDDVRANYFLVGATWTANGVPGVGNQLPVVKGSRVLANATMETYFQYKNCFSCHQGGNLGGLSHIFGSITPLPVR